MTTTVATEELPPVVDIDTSSSSESYGVIGVFDNVTSVIKTTRAVREAGFTRFDVHSPFPIHGIDEAMGIKPTILPWIILACGTIGCVGGLALAVFTMAAGTEGTLPTPWGPLTGYQFMISGKPLLSIPAFIPVIFECTILFAAFGAVFGMFLLNRLPMLYRPLFKIPAFRRATNDRIVIAVEAIDPKYDENEITALLLAHGAQDVQTVEE